MNPYIELVSTYLRERETDDLSGLLFDLLLKHRTEALRQLDQVGEACDASGKYPISWRNSSTMATRLSEARMIAKTARGSDYETASSFSELVKLARDRKKKNKRQTVVRTASGLLVSYLSATEQLRIAIEARFKSLAEEARAQGAKVEYAVTWPSKSERASSK